MTSFCTGRVAPIGSELMDVCQRIAPVLNPEAFVVSRPLPFGNAGRDLARICRRAGVQLYRDPFHTLRKACIDDWARAGYPPAVAQKWAGHTDVKTTLVFYNQATEKRPQLAGGKLMMGHAGLFPACHGSHWG